MSAMPSLARRACPFAVALILALAAGGAAAANLVVNGSFETGPAVGATMPIATGATSITGWTVTRAGIDYIGTAWTSASGGRNLALNGSAAGGVAQSFSSIPLARYSVRFWMTGDPGSTPVIKQMRVEAAGQSADFSADITGMWEWDPGWNWHAWSFTANANTTTIEFYSLMTGDTGPTLDSVTVALSSTVGVDPSEAPAFALSSFAPNPMRDASTIEFSLPQAMSVRLAVYDLTGREVAVLAEGPHLAGPHVARWDGRNARGRASSGVYYVQLTAPGRRATQRIVVLR